MAMKLRLTVRSILFLFRRNNGSYIDGSRSMDRSSYGMTPAKKEEGEKNFGMLSFLTSLT